MNIAKVAFCNFRTNLRNDGPLLLSLAFSVLILLNFLMILFTDAFLNAGESGKNIINDIMSAGSILLGCFIFFFVWYSTDIFLVRYKRESGIYVLLGLNSELAGRLYLAQTLMTGLAVLALGLFSGILITPLFQMILGAVSGIKVELTFQFAAEPLYITAGVFLSIYFLFSVWGYANITRCSVLGMIPASRSGERDMMSTRGLLYRAVSGAGSLAGGCYLSASKGRALLAAGALMTAGIYQVFGGLLPLVLCHLSADKGFLYRKERIIWINNAACRMSRNHGTYATACVLMLWAQTALAAGSAIKEWYGAADITPDQGGTAWGRILYAVAICMFLVFLMAGGSVMLAKVHQDILGEKEHYAFLRKTGMDPDILLRAVSRELAMIYACPFVVMLPVSVFLVCALERLMTVDLGMVYIVGMFFTSGFFLLLYLLSIMLYGKSNGNR